MIDIIKQEARQRLDDLVREASMLRNLPMRPHLAVELLEAKIDITRESLFAIERR